MKKEINSIDKDIQTIGQNIAMLRMDAGHSQEQFAEMIGISKNALGKIERGDSAPRADTLTSICRVLHVTPNEIMPKELSKDRENSQDVLSIANELSGLSSSQREQVLLTMKIYINGMKNLNY